MFVLEWWSAHEVICVCTILCPLSPHYSYRYCLQRGNTVRILIDKTHCLGHTRSLSLFICLLQTLIFLSNRLFWRCLLFMNLLFLFESCFAEDNGKIQWRQKQCVIFQKVFIMIGHLLFTHIYCIYLWNLHIYAFSIAVHVII